MKKASLSKRVYSILPVALQLWGRIDSEANTQSNKGERILTVIKERNQGTQNGKGDNRNGNDRRTGAEDLGDAR